jgi:hypothetical protein
LCGGCVETCGDAAFPFSVHQDLEEVAMQVVHGVVFVVELSCFPWITRECDVFGGVADVNGGSAIFAKYPV